MATVMIFKSDKYRADKSTLEYVTNSLVKNENTTQLYQGFSEKFPEVGVWLIRWITTAHHDNWRKDPETPKVVGTFQGALNEGEKLKTIHVEPTDEYLDQVLKAPLTEVAIPQLKEGADFSALKKCVDSLAKALRTIEGCYGASVCTEVGKENSYAFFIGWETSQHHVDATPILGQTLLEMRDLVDMEGSILHYADFKPAA